MSDVDTDGLVKKILEGLKGSRQSVPDDDEWEEAPPRGRAGERIRSLVRDLKRERERNAAFEAQLTELASGYESKVAAIQEQTAAELKRIQTSTQQDFALHEAGLTDPLGRSTLRQAWEGTPAAERGKSPVELWSTWQEAHKAHHADPENVAAPNIPRPFLPYLPQPETQDAPPEQQQRGRPRIDAATRQAPKSGIPADIMGATTLDELFSATRKHS